MKQTVKNAALGLAMLSIALAVPTTGSAQAPSKTQIQTIIKSKVSSALDEALRDLRGVRVGLPTCQSEFDQAVQAAEQEGAACLNVDSPPAGSPLANFNNLSNIGVQQFCANLTGDQCAAKVLQEQKLFCAKERARDIAKAKSIKARCQAEVQQCNDAKAAVTNARSQIAQLERQLAVLRASLPTLEAKAQAECR